MQRPVYLDNHATTPCDPRVVDAMLPYFTERFGNAASRGHSYGLEAKAGAELAREQVAARIGASPKEIVFTSGATEANNLAVLGVARASTGRHVVTTAIEHKAVLDPCARLRTEGFDVTVVAVGPSGVVEVAAIEAALRPDTAIVSVMTANNEIGTVQPVAEIGALCRARGIPFHTDAAQALGRIPVSASDADLISLSAHKCYGPKGVGALYMRRGRPKIPIEPILWGGGHERGLRSGTLPVPLLVGFGRAAELADPARESAALRDRLWRGLAAIPGVALNGDAERRLPNNLNLSIADVEAEALLMGLRDVVALSSGSACTSATLEPSYVLRAIGVPAELAHASLRFGVGRFNTEAEIDRVVAAVAAKVAELRALSPLYDVRHG